MEEDTEYEEPKLKKVKVAIDLSKGNGNEKSFSDFVQVHPFLDSSHSVVDVFSDGVFRDAKGTIVGFLIRNALPEKAASMAADVLRSAAQKSSLRSNIYGGEPPNSGIAGYFDYRGSPIQYKSRKTSFTYTNAESWPNVFPMVNYVNDFYKQLMPQNWEHQNSCIPDVVRINGSVFSTLTINSRFRTARHTDVGDFDGGYSCIACLEGEFKGLALTFDEFQVSFYMKPRDLMIFNPHHFHSNTELEDADNNSNWSRLTCVFYYRAQLGEPWSYAEYRRRLSTALKLGISIPPAVKKIIEKSNGTHLNKPAQVFSSKFSPFVLPICSNTINRCASKALKVHNILMINCKFAELLFGELLETPDGIPDRNLEDKKVAFNSVPNYATGGFSTTKVELNKAGESESLLQDDSLMKVISEDLFSLWAAALQKWLQLVEKDWDRMVRINSNRLAFTWNNKSDMNCAFFELCDVAKEVMHGILNVDTASKIQENWFWSNFAFFLNRLVVSKLQIPRDAISLTKINVKIKDFHFGGTRYFKDMPPDEQQRRLERKKRIEEARKRGAKTDRSSDWLENDSFDYQSEDCSVDFRSLGLPVPKENTENVLHRFSEALKLTKQEEREEIKILVVVPRAGSIDKIAIQSRAQSLLSSENHEFYRLLGNSAAQRILQNGTPFYSLPHPWKYENVSVMYSFIGDPVGTPVDFVIVQHALSTLDDLDAKGLIRDMQKKAMGCLFVVETDRLCRNYFTIKPEICKKFDEASHICFSTLHEARYASIHPKFRSLCELEFLCGKCASRFKFLRSPLNSVLYAIE